MCKRAEAVLLIQSDYTLRKANCRYGETFILVTLVQQPRLKRKMILELLAPQIGFCYIRFFWTYEVS